MVRVLNITECMQSAGIESYIMNVYRNIDRNKVQFDFFVTRNEKEFYDDEIKALGGKKFVTDHMKIKSTFLRVILESIDLYKFLKKEKYSIIQVHTGTPLRVFYLISAKLSKVETRIYHSHSAEVFGPHKGLFIKKKIFKVLKQFIPFLATNMFACSKEAGKWMYPKRVQEKVEVIKNGIILDKFVFNEEVRKKYRKDFNIEYNIKSEMKNNTENKTSNEIKNNVENKVKNDIKEGVENKVIIGHVARFNNQKNHTFLIDVMNEVVKENKSYILWLIGSGELEEEIKEKVKRLNLEENIIFLGVRDDVNNLMQAMDIFVLPSNYEGLPVVGIEAQASGLSCLFSSKITNEVKITDKCKFIDLNIEDWKNAILNEKIDNKRDYKKEIEEAKYDIKSTVNYLERIYTK